MKRLGLFLYNVASFFAQCFTGEVVPSHRKDMKWILSIRAEKPTKNDRAALLK